MKGPQRQDRVCPAPWTEKYVEPLLWSQLVYTMLAYAMDQIGTVEVYGDMCFTTSHAILEIYCKVKTCFL